MKTGILIVGVVSVAMIASADSKYYTPTEAVTQLSRIANTLEVDMRRREVIDRLGEPTWVLLRGDKSEFAPGPGEFLDLLWRNGPCVPVAASFHESGRLTGWDEGRGLCVKAGDYDLIPPLSQFRCSDKRRARFCK